MCEEVLHKAKVWSQKDSSLFQACDTTQRAELAITATDVWCSIVAAR